MLNINSTLTLNNGVKMPIFGFGAYALPEGQAGQDAIACALQNGYRHIDTASAYQNEDLVGNAWTASGLKREELFITTKLWENEQGATETPAALDRSLQKLKTDYVDLYLIHWPHPDDSRTLPCWQAMQALVASGKCRAIGVCNFTRRRLGELISTSDTLPAVNQVEFNLFLYKRELAAYCHSHDILLEAYSPLARCKRLDNPQLQTIAKSYGKSGTQIMLRWCLEHGIPAIPKSANPQRIKENADIFDFEIAAEDMCLLDSLNENFEASDWRPDNYY
jgi:diketogulonate reductase-like aldo/keto reductase